jgi:hypothetical protein
MKTLATYEVRFPTWAICPLINGDACECAEEDALIEAFEAEYLAIATDMGGTVTYQLTDDEAYFTSSPEFGLPCNVEDMTVYIFDAPTISEYVHDARLTPAKGVSYVTKLAN